MSDVHSNRAFMCAICDIKFVSNRLLQRHVEIRHKQGNLEKVRIRRLYSIPIIIQIILDFNLNVIPVQYILSLYRDV